MAQFDLNNIPEEPTTGTPAPQYDLSKIPDTQVDLNSIPEEQAPSFLQKAQSAIGNAATQAGSMLVNPIGGAVEVANQIPGVKDYIPDFLANNDTAKGTVKGVYNAARNVGQLGADIQDAVLPGTATPMSDMLNTVAPTAQYDGYTQAISGNITEVASGFLLGNKIGAIAKAKGLAPDVASTLEKYAPEVAKKTVSYLSSFIKSATQGIGGMAATVTPTNSGLVVGKDTLTHLGMGDWLDGLPTNGPDAAINAINMRVNMALDAIAVGGSAKLLLGSLKFLATNGPTGQLVKKTVGQMAPVFSEAARMKLFFEGIGKELKKIKGAEKPEVLQQIQKRLTELVSNKEAQIFKGDVGIEGVGDVAVPLDVATTVGRQVPAESTNAVDVGIRNTLQGEAKKLAGMGYEEAARTREGPVRALGSVLEQTQAAMGGAKSAEAGASEVQNLGDAAVQQGKTEQVLAQNEATNTLGTARPIPGISDKPNIIESANRAEDIRTAQANDLYDKIPKEDKYDPSTLTKVVKDNLKDIPNDIIDTIAAGDGSFKYLVGTVRPEISMAIHDLEGVPGLENRNTLTALKKLRDNIDVDQIQYLKDNGKSASVNAVEKAKSFFESEVAPNRQGLVGQLRKIRFAKGLNTDELFTESRAALRKEIGNTLNPEHERRLFDVLASDEGARTADLIEKYKTATDKAAELSLIEKDVYGNRLREFYNQRSPYPGTRNENGVEAFQKLLEDPQNFDRIKYMVDLAEKEGSPGVQQALKYSYSRAFEDKLLTGHVTSTGGERIAAPAVRGILNNDSFLKAGKEIFKDNPKYMKVVSDLLELSNDIQRSSYLKGAPIGPQDTLVASAEKGLRRTMAPIFGPLSHAGYTAKTYFATMLDAWTPQGALHQMADGLMNNGDYFANAWETFLNPKESPANVTKAAKILINTMVHSDGDRKRIEKSSARIRTQLQTDEALKGSSGKDQTKGDAGDDLLEIEKKIHDYSTGAISTKELRQHVKDIGWSFGSKGLRGKGEIELFDPKGNAHYTYG